MKTHILLLTLASCPKPAFMWTNPTAGETAAVEFEVPEASYPFLHRTLVKVRQTEEAEWSYVKAPSSDVLAADHDVRIPTGVNHFQFYGRYYREIPPQPAPEKSGVELLDSISDLLTTLAPNDPPPSLECRAEIAIDVGADVELAFVHTRKNECRVQCTERTPKGPVPCRIEG